MFDHMDHKKKKFDHMGQLKMALPLSAIESPLPNNPRYKIKGTVMPDDPN